MAKLILHRFRCTDCSETADELVKPDVKHIVCPGCGSPARRIITPVRLDYQGLAMHDGMETAIGHFDRVHREQREIERRRMQEHGDYGPAPGAD